MLQRPRLGALREHLLDGGAVVVAHSGGAVDGGGGALVGRQAAVARVGLLRLEMVEAARGGHVVRGGHVHAGAAGVGARGGGGGGGLFLCACHVNVCECCVRRGVCAFVWRLMSAYDVCESERVEVERTAGNSLDGKGREGKERKDVSGEAAVLQVQARPQRACVSKKE